MRDRSRAVELRCDWSNRIRPGVGHGRNKVMDQSISTEPPRNHLEEDQQPHKCTPGCSQVAARCVRILGKPFRTLKLDWHF